MVYNSGVIACLAIPLRRYGIICECSIETLSVRRGGSDAEGLWHFLGKPNCPASFPIVQAFCNQFHKLRTLGNCEECKSIPSRGYPICRIRERHTLAAR